MSLKDHIKKLKQEYSLTKEANKSITRLSLRQLTQPTSYSMRSAIADDEAECLHGQSRLKSAALTTSASNERKKPNMKILSNYQFNFDLIARKSFKHNTSTSSNHKQFDHNQTSNQKLDFDFADLKEQVKRQFFKKLKNQDFHQHQSKAKIKSQEKAFKDEASRIMHNHQGGNDETRRVGEWKEGSIYSLYRKYKLTINAAGIHDSHSRYITSDAIPKLISSRILSSTSRNRSVFEKSEQMISLKDANLRRFESNNGGLNEFAKEMKELPCQNLARKEVVVSNKKYGPVEGYALGNFEVEGKQGPVERIALYMKSLRNLKMLYFGLYSSKSLGNLTINKVKRELHYLVCEAISKKLDIAETMRDSLRSLGVKAIELSAAITICINQSKAYLITVGSRCGIEVTCPNKKTVKMVCSDDLEEDSITVKAIALEDAAYIKMTSLANFKFSMNNASGSSQHDSGSVHERLESILKQAWYEANTEKHIDQISLILLKISKEKARPMKIINESIKHQACQKENIDIANLPKEKKCERPTSLEANSKPKAGDKSWRRTDQRHAATDQTSNGHILIQPVMILDADC